MKLLTIDSREVGGRPGVLLDNGEILDLAAAPNSLSESQWIPYSVVSVVAAGQDGLDRIGHMVASVQQTALQDRERLVSEGVLLPYASTTLMAPVRRPGLILVIGPESTAHMKSPNTAVGDGASVSVPASIEDELTGSGMIGIVMGRPFYRASPDEAAAAIAGYTLVIDLGLPRPAASASLTEWQRYWDSKQFPGACPIGPAIITKDELPPPDELEAAVRINDVEVGSGRLFSGARGIVERLASVSRQYSFRPGDLVVIECAAEDVGGPRSLTVGDEYTLNIRNQMELTVTLA